MALVGVVGAARGDTPEGSTPVSQLWAVRHDGPGSGDDVARALAVSPDGSTVFVTGSSWGVDTYDDHVTVAYGSASGAELWVARYDANESVDVARALAVSPDGSTVFVTGDRGGAESFSDYGTIAYDASSGEQLWTARYDRDYWTDVAHALAVSPDGSKVFVTGGTKRYNEEGVYDYTTVAYDAASGTEVWVAAYDGEGYLSDLALALAVSPDGSDVFVTGYTDRDNADFDYLTMAYDAASGAERWMAFYDGTEENDDFARAIAVSPDGSKVLVTGSSYPSGDYATGDWHRERVCPTALILKLLPCADERADLPLRHAAGRGDRADPRGCRQTLRPGPTGPAAGSLR